MRHAVKALRGRWPAPVLLAALSLCPVWSCGQPGQESIGQAGGSRVDHEPVFGEGFLVWESNRSGNWRIWIRELDKPAARQLTQDDGSREHCCPHISPDGKWVAYLSLADALKGYAAGGAKGKLHLIEPDGTSKRELASSSRALFENRAVVWRSSEQLIYIRADGTTMLYDLAANTSEELTDKARDSDTTWLINSRLTHAASGQADFSPYDPGNRTIAPRTALGGCQPYFSHDGRWGFWTAATGGPIKRVDLATGEVSTILEKSDPRIPDGLGYTYFPMFSTDARLFAFAASAYEHSHFKADYEVFVAESDPGTLELVGSAVRMTDHPATDRFPDVFLAPLPLGRRRGEAPFEVLFEPRSDSGSARWTFDFGDGTSGSLGRHTYQTAGHYEVRAYRGSRAQDSELRGRVTVKPARAPRPVRVSLRNEGRAIEVLFDEQIQAQEPVLELGSGRSIASWTLGEEGRSLVVEPVGRIDGFDRLRIEGIGDRAQRPNWIEALTVDIEAPLWPSNRDGLVFLWATGESSNLVKDPELGIDRACSVVGSGRAHLDHDYAMVLGQGSFSASSADADFVLNACTKTNQFALEAVVRPAKADTDGLARIISFSSGVPRGRNALLAQRRDRLVFSPRAGNRAAPEIELGVVEAGESHHVLVSYRTGRLTAYLNGAPVVDMQMTSGFFHWKRRPLVFGAGPQGDEAWSGTLEGVAIYNRFLEADEARENHLRYERELESRSEVPLLVVDATLISRSKTPDLAEITPYREALSVFEYSVERVIEGAFQSRRLRVAEWSILDGDVLEIERLPIGSRRRLALEPLTANRQLESVYMADTLETATEPLFYAVRPSPP